MLRAAHYKSSEQQDTLSKGSPAKHRPGGILDLALTAADRYALSLLPNAGKVTGLSNDGTHQQPSPGEYQYRAHNHPVNGVSPAVRQRSQGQQMMHTMQQPVGSPGQQAPQLDSRMVNSWDTSLKEILSALEPDGKSIKPAKLRDYRYPAQNHGTALPSSATQRALEEAMATIPGGRKGKAPTYGSPSKPSSRVARRAELQGVEVQYDLLPGVKLAWANTGTYTSGPSSSPKKYTSTLVGKTSPHYSSSRAAASGSPGQDPDAMHLPDIGTNSPGRSPGYSSGQHHGYGHSSPHGQSGFRGSPQAAPSHQAWAQHATTTTITPRKPLPYVSTTVPSLAKPLTVQYHPVLRSPTTPLGGLPGPEGSVSQQRPATDGDQGLDQQGFAPPHRVPYTPPEVAAELARLRHTQDLDGVITSIKYDLQAAAGVRSEPSKTKFLQMYEDPNRPLASLNPKQLLAELTPAKGKKEASRSVGGKSSEKPGRLVTGLSPSVSPSGGPLRRSPMYERRLKPITSVTGTSAAVPPARPSATGQLPAAAPEPEADTVQELMRNLHLQPPEVPGEQEQKGVGAADAEAPASQEAAGPTAERGEGASKAEGDLSGDDRLGAADLEASGRATPVSTVCGEDEAAAAALASAAEEAEAQVAPGASAALDLVPKQPAGEEVSGTAAEAAATGGDDGAMLAGDEAAGEVVVVHGGELAPPAELPLVDEQPADAAQATPQQQEAPQGEEDGPGVVPGEQQALAEQAAGSGYQPEGQMGGEPAGEELPLQPEPEPQPPESDQPEAAAAGEQAAGEALGAQECADAPAAPEQADAAALEEQERPASAALEAPAAAAQAEMAPDAGVSVGELEAGAQPAEALAAELPAEGADGAQPVSLEAQPEGESAETAAVAAQEEQPTSAAADVAAEEQPSHSGFLEEALPEETAAPAGLPAAAAPAEAPEPGEPAPEPASAAGGEAEPDATQAPVEQEGAGAEEPQPASAEPEEQADMAPQAHEGPQAAVPEPAVQDAGTAAAVELQEASGTGEPAGGMPAAATAETEATPVAAEDEQAPVSLPPGVGPEVAEPAVVLIQTHMRGHLARKRVAQMRSEREAGQVALAAAAIAVAVEKEEQQQEEDAARQGVSLPPGVTPGAAAAAATRVQAHMRGHLARKRVALMRKQRRRAPAIDPATYELPAGASEEQLVRVQAHMRGHLARRKVAVLKQRKTASEAYQPPAGASKEQVEAAAVHVQAHMRGYLARKHVASLRKRRLAALDAADAAGTEAEEHEMLEAELAPEPELTVDALQAALAEDAEEADSIQAGQEADVGLASDTQEQQGQLEAPLDDPLALAAAAAAAAAKGAVLVLGDLPPGGAEEGQDVDPAADQAAEANIERMAATSARMSAMFQGAGAEMRYSDDEAGALDLIENLDGLLDGNDDAAAVAAAVAAAATPAEGEIVSISPFGVSEPQALQPSPSGAERSGSAAASPSPGGPAVTASPRPPNPKDTMEPGGVRVLNGKYEVQHMVGEGAYGMVMKCKVRGTEPVQWVAIKEFKIEDNDPDAEDVKRTSLREVSVLETLQHPHVVRFVDKFMVGDRLFIVMEFLPCNLLELLEAQPGGMDRDAVRLIMFQLCSAIAFIHSKSMVYRDIKPENLLVDERGTVKLCDFGFARRLPSGPSSHLTDYVATRWYRAPELLLGPPFRDATGKHVQYMYGPQVDLWAIGCLMGELLDGEPLFAGDSDLDQLYRVQQILGPMAPSHQYLFYANPHNTGIVFNIKQPLSLAARYQGKVSDVELDFLSGLLEMDPDKRMTGEQCLQHPYLADLAAAAQGMPSAPSSAASTTSPTPPSGPGRPSGAGDVGTPRASISGVEAAAAALGSLTPSRNGSLQRTPGSLTRTPGSTTRAGGGGSFSGTPLRMGSLVRTEGDEQVVVIEGVVEGDEEGVAEAEAEQLTAVSAPVEVGGQGGEVETD